MILSISVLLVASSLTSSMPVIYRPACLQTLVPTQVLGFLTLHIVDVDVLVFGDVIETPSLVITCFSSLIIARQFIYKCGTLA